MAPLDIRNLDDFQHLIQLFLYAYPEHKALNEEVRDHVAMPGEYFLSLPMVEAMVRWGRQQHLVTRRQGEELLCTARQSFAQPHEVITLVPCVLGTPPRRQLGVRGSHIFQWIYCQAVNPEDPEYVLTLEAAGRLCDAVGHDDACSTEEQRRAQILSAWLKTQQEEATEDACE